MIKNILNTISARITAMMMVIMIIPILLIGYNLHYLQKEEAVQDHLTDLKVIFKQTIREIDTHIQYQKQLLSTIASMPEIAQTLLHHNSRQPLTLDPEVQAYVANFIHKYNYYDFFIISNRGDIVYTFKKEEDYGKNINDPLVRESGLAHVYNHATSLLDTSVSSLQYYSPSKRKASFIATPIIINEKIVGVIALQFRETYMANLIKQHSSLGKTGEMVAGMLMEDGRVLAAIPLKYDQNAFKNERILNSRGKSAEPMVQAVSGHSGVGETVDYRGVNVVAVWGYEPTLRWGIVVKTDRDEVFETIYQQEKKLLYIVLFAIVAVGFMIGIGAVSVTKPIHALITAVQKFRQEGVCDPNPIECFGEMCYLTEEFTGMAAEIESYQRDLEAKIEERTKELQAAKKILEEMSITDQLTGLYNRRHLDAMCEENVQLYERYKTPFSIVIIDLDNFKCVNDTYGHQIGDYVLQRVADILKRECRTTDIIGRWGGEEFLIIFPNLEESEAVQAAEKLRVAIEMYPFETVGRKTASFGVSGYIGSMEETLKKADEALYMAKEQGRNCVISKKCDLP